VNLFALDSLALACLKSAMENQQESPATAAAQAELYSKMIQAQEAHWRSLAKG
jgi:hypothetical protein